jgi:hypothetical protein
MLPPDPGQSADPTIQQMFALHTRLSKKVASLNQHLYAYAMLTDREEIEAPEVSALDHYNMLDEPSCSCDICVDWHTRRDEFVQVAKLIPKGHKWTVCGCDNCRFVGRIQLNFLAASNRRDLLIEMSFHARYHSNHGQTVMGWLIDELQKPVYTVNWCAQEMSRFPMARWIQRCEHAVSGLVSGAVFCNSTMATDVIVSSRSTLTADVSGFDAYF